jgi:hypothetical protein
MSLHTAGEQRLNIDNDVDTPNRKLLIFISY